LLGCLTIVVLKERSLETAMRTNDGGNQEAKYHPSRFEVAIREDVVMIPRLSAAGPDKGHC
jgi:hypothetical protein